MARSQFWVCSSAVHPQGHLHRHTFGLQQPPRDPGTSREVRRLELRLSALARPPGGVFAQL
eukprot:8220260-Alexandrium_andersonii.AAC.1